MTSLHHPEPLLPPKSGGNTLPVATPPVKPAALLLVLLLLCGACMPAPEMWHDDANKVTCWTRGNSGLQCFPDYQLKQPYNWRP